MKDVLLVALAILALGNAAEAKPQPVAATPADATAPTTNVEELTVTSEAACLAPKPESSALKPKIVSTFPANGAMVRPGVLVVRVTFDQPMSCKGFFTSIPKLRDPCPLGHQQWVVSFDRKTIRMVCHAEGNVAYGIGLSDNPDATFVSLGGRSLEPFEFRFLTSVAPDVLSPGESLDEDPDFPRPKPADQPLVLQEAHVKK
jgi:hypothetical protein